MARPIVLFDIDLTIIRTGGAGRHAMRAAYERTVGAPFPLDDGFRFDGQTDSVIFDALSASVASDDDAEGLRETLIAAYLQQLPASLAERNGNVLPGVLELFAALDREGTTTAAATGNLRRGAELKLQHFGLDRWLATGGFGDRARTKADAVAEALAALDTGNAGHVAVIGDTPQDIAAAHAHGALAVAVASGNYTVKELRVAGADAAFDDLRDTTRVLSLLLG